MLPLQLGCSIVAPNGGLVKSRVAADEVSVHSCRCVVGRLGQSFRDADTDAGRGPGGCPRRSALETRSRSRVQKKNGYPQVGKRPPKSRSVAGGWAPILGSVVSWRGAFWAFRLWRGEVCSRYPPTYEIGRLVVAIWRYRYQVPGSRYLYWSNLFCNI